MVKNGSGDRSKFLDIRVKYFLTLLCHKYDLRNQEKTFGVEKNCICFLKLSIIEKRMLEHVLKYL